MAEAVGREVPASEVRETWGLPARVLAAGVKSRSDSLITAWV